MALELESRQFSNTEENVGQNVFSFNIAPDFGMMFGMLQEWVFINRDGRTSFDDVYSRLDWQLNPLFYIGAAGSLMPIPRLFFGFGGWLGIPGLLGYEEDRDWDELTGVYEVYSYLNNVLSNALFLDFNVGYSLVYQTFLTFNCIIGFNLKQFHMVGQDGWQESPPGTFDQYLVGPAIDYELNYFIPYIAGELAWAPVNWLSFDLFLSVCPFLTFVYDRDYHILRDLTFQDLPVFGFYIASALSISIYFGSGFSFNIKGNFQWAPPFKGNTYMEGYRVVNARGGSSLLLGGISIGFKYTFSTQAPPAPVAPPNDQLRLPR
jgi:outer membrane protease